MSAAAVVLLAASVLFAMGRVPICTCGTIKLWHGVVNSSENSQHIMDWYTASHVLHGFIFYMLLWWLAPAWPIGVRLFVATVIEATWEILENTPMIIERYRAATISLDYFGDSILNSVSDIGAMMIGFYLARRLPVAVTIGLGIASELFMAWMIRDNLALNVLMLMYPIDAVKVWQGGG